MKVGHHPGYRIQKVGEHTIYYCLRHPELVFKKLTDYDLHYEIDHTSFVLDGFDLLGTRKKRSV